MKHTSRVVGSMALAVFMLFLFLGCPTSTSPTDTSGDQNEDDTIPSVPVIPKPKGTEETVSGELDADAIEDLIENITDKLSTGDKIHTVKATEAAPATITLAATDELEIPAGGTLILDDHVTLDLSAAGAEGDAGKVEIKGTIQVEKGAAVIVGTEDYFVDSGTIEFVPGSSASIKQDADTTTSFLGSTSSSIYSWSGTSGSLVMGKDSLTLQSGTLVVNGQFPYSVIQPGDTTTIKSGATLRVADTAEFRLLPAAGSDAAAKLVVEGRIEVAGSLTFDAPFGSGADAAIAVNGNGAIVLQKGSILTVPKGQEKIVVVGKSDTANAYLTWPASNGETLSIEIGAGTSLFTLKGSGTITLAKEYMVYGSDTFVVDTGVTLALTKKLIGEVNAAENASTITINGTVTNGSDGDKSPFYGTDGSTEEITIQGTYKWSTDKWVKQ